MKLLGIVCSFAFAIIHSARADQPAPSALPEIGPLDCFASFASGTDLPEKNSGEMAIDGDNFDIPSPRYRIEIVEGKILKLIYWPQRPALRTEYGKNAAEMTRDSTNKHQIVGWVESSSSGVKMFTINFEDRLLSILELPKANKLMSQVELHVLKCR